MRHAAGRDVADAVYGLILATSVIAVQRQYDPGHAGVTAVAVAGTAIVFWLAHVYAGVLAVGLERKHRPTLVEVRHVIDEEWPLVQACLLPTALLLLGPLGVLKDATAQWVALIACIVELGLVGVWFARASGARGPIPLLSGVVGIALGVILTLLKVLVH